MSRLWVGIMMALLGLLLGFAGSMTFGPDLRPVATGLIAVGLVMASVSLVERRLDSSSRVRSRR